MRTQLHKRFTYPLVFLFLIGAGFWIKAESSTPLLPAPPVEASTTPNMAIDDTNLHNAPARLGKPLNTSIPGDPLQFFASASIKGGLVYAFNIFKSAGSAHYLVIRNAESITTYPIEAIGKNSIYDPQFSPDGSRVLFKIGAYGTEHPSYRLHLLDIKTRKLTRAAERELNYPVVEWSPDGRYLAYVAGGDYQGNFDERRNNDLCLFICNIESGRERLITRGDSILEGFSWSFPHTFFYSGTPAPPKSTSAKKTDVDANSHTNIYEVITDLEANKIGSRLLIKDAWRPVISPDRKRIAFFGSEDVKRPVATAANRSNSDGVALSVAERDGTDRRALNREVNNYPTIFWDSDSRYLITLKQTQASPNGKAQIRKWDIADGKWQQIAMLSAKDSERISRSVVEPQFAVKKTEATKLFVVANSVVGQDEQNLSYEMDDTLSAIELNTGKTTVIAKIRNGSGLGWHSTGTN